MAKGDREIFKADIDDGYTKIADLLLEALAMAKLNGVQKGICLFIWRRTYGWGIKEDRIPLKEFARACDSSETYISKQIKQLVGWKIILRTSYEPGKVPSFTINTRIAQWDKGCLNEQGLNDCISQGLYKCARVPLSDCARVDQDSALEREEIEAPLKTDIYTGIDDDDITRARKARIVRTIEQEYGRPATPSEFQDLAAYLKDMDVDVICEAVIRSRANGSPHLKYTKGILNNWIEAKVTNMAGVERVDNEFEKRKRQRDGPSRAAKPKGDGKYAKLGNARPEDFL
ncbi:MAG: replication protein [Firmicutes bacterium]|nr:replication protein [Bacillota bacterium]